MKLWALKLFLEILKSKKKILLLFRVDDNIIKIVFDTGVYFFDMRRSESLIYPEPAGFVETKKYNSPFDVQLTKIVANSEIIDTVLLGDDKIIKIDIQKSGKYKSKRSSLIFEFTGKFTNVVVTDDKDTIIDVLRHIDSSVSIRELKPTLKYTLPPKADIKYSLPEEIDDIEKYLQEIYNKKQFLELENLKKQHIVKIAKKRKKLEKILLSLESAEKLKEKSANMYEKANLLLANRSSITPYEKNVLLKDYEGNDITVEIESAGGVNRTIDEMFKRAKKFANKSKSVHIESQNLESKIAFLKKFEYVVNMADSKHELQILFPKILKNTRSPKGKKEPAVEHYEVFFVKGYRILLGKSEKGNAELLKIAKAGDIWMHLKDRPSTHIIIPTNKKEIPLQVLTEAAKLCASFSADFAGNYLIDYTQRRNVKIQSGANVEYKFYKTLHITI